MQTPTSAKFPSNVKRALANETLQRVMSGMAGGLLAFREAAVKDLPEFGALRDEGKRIKDHTLDHLDFYLETFEQKVEASGGSVHWARTAEDARAAVLKICRDAKAKKIIKGKSMISEEVGLNAALEESGLEVVETDLGEYIIQLRKETPSHILAPALHVNPEQVAQNFRDEHKAFDPGRALDEPQSLVSEARSVLRDHFLSADVGITGANFLVAETGTAVIVTNEGNGDFCMTQPRVHIVVASIEKTVPTLNDTATLLRLLSRSATGQALSVYTTFATGPKRRGDADGVEEFHVVMLDNGRSEILGTERRDMLRCIRCAACMNYCPVYRSIGGHAYGWVYPGPMGAVLTPSFIGIREGRHLPNASTLCGRCEEVCPVRIPLTRMMRHWREQEFERHINPVLSRWALRLWAAFAKRPTLYKLASRFGSVVLRKLGGGTGRLKRLPFVGGWTSVRDLPAPESKTFRDLWAEREEKRIP